jgi:hypothetical protein
MFTQEFRMIGFRGQRRRSRCAVLALFLGCFCGPGFISGANLSQAVVRQKVNVVTVAPNLGGTAQPAAQGAVIHDENVVRTGVESRAELEFSDLTLARLGANSIFSFDAKARAMNFTQGAVLFSKPTKSGPVELRTGAITAAITGSTGFISKSGSSSTHAKKPNSATLVGMLEGKLHGGARWTDAGGHEHTTNFKLGPGELLVARLDGPPRVVTFDLPRFLRTSPLVTGFRYPLLNQAELNQAVADYKADERGGFIDQTNVMLVSTKPSVWNPSTNQMPIEVSVAELNKLGGAGFLNVGGTGVIRGQLVWRTDADLDLYLTLPNGQQVSFRNVSVTFNNGNATARLDHDNLGRTIDVQPNIRVENIVVNGVPLSGLYSFFVNNFGSQNASDAFTLRVNYNGQTQLVTGSLANGQTSKPVTVTVPGSPGG